MMRRRDALRAGIGAAGAAVLGGGLARAEDPVAEADMSSLMKKAGALFSAPVEATTLSEGLSLVTGPGGNIAALAGPDGLIMVDSGVPNRGKDLQDATTKLGGVRPVAVLINTHWHFDHSGGNAAFGKDGTKIWATPATRRRLDCDQFNEMFQMKSPAAPREGLPVLTFDEAEAACGRETFHMVAVPPAHTDGDLVIHFREADVIHAGDLFNNGFYPNIDASSRGWIGGMIAGSDRILKMAGPKTRIIPGHGPLATVDDLKAFPRDAQDRPRPPRAAGRREDAARRRPPRPAHGRPRRDMGQGPLQWPAIHQDRVRQPAQASSRAGPVGANRARCAAKSNADMDAMHRDTEARRDSSGRRMISFEKRSAGEGIPSMPADETNEVAAVDPPESRRQRGCLVEREEVCTGSGSSPPMPAAELEGAGD